MFTVMHHPTFQKFLAVMVVSDKETVKQIELMNAVLRL